ncbi:MAG: amidohydrolase family protein [Promethearchaeota archaeon]|jgi:predicted TIM-barrel fold metal-dependent hydrolase
MDRFNVEKAIITTINRSKYHKKQKEVVSQVSKGNEVTKFMDGFKEIILKGQLDHTDVKAVVKNAPERFYKFFWFNPNMNPEEEEKDYKILEEHFKEGFCGVKIHSGFHMINVPEDILKLVSFMQDFDENLIFYIHSLPKTSFFKGISPVDIANLAKKFPNLRIIVGHAANTMSYAVEVGMTLNYDNIFFETSCSVSFGIYNLIKTIGHERILFGSDSPTASTLPIEIEKIISLPRISTEVKQDILYNNVTRLLKNIK